MKKLIITSIAALLVLSACQQSEMVVSPDLNLQPTDEVISKSQNWLRFDESNDFNFQKKKIKSKKIHHSRGGSIALKLTSVDNGMRTRSAARIKFSPNSWNKDLYGEEIEISMEVDDELVALTFTPHMNFDETPILDLIFKGIDLSMVNNIDDIKFVYLAENGSYEQMEYDRLIINKSRGLIKVRGAKIPHFSRFGFLN